MTCSLSPPVSWESKRTRSSFVHFLHGEYSNQVFANTSAQYSVPKWRHDKATCFVRTWNHSMGRTRSGIASPSLPWFFALIVSQYFDLRSSRWRVMKCTVLCTNDCSTRWTLVLSWSSLQRSMRATYHSISQTRPNEQMSHRIAIIVGCLLVFHIHLFGHEHKIKTKMSLRDSIYDSYLSPWHHGNRHRGGQEFLPSIFGSLLKSGDHSLPHNMQTWPLFRQIAEITHQIMVKVGHFTWHIDDVAPYIKKSFHWNNTWKFHLRSSF